MESEQTIIEFLLSNKKLLQEYVELRIDIFKLELLRTNAKTSGIIVWLVVSLFMLFLILIFAGISISFWLAEMLHSNAAGFGITTGILVIITLLITLFRKSFFINPVIRIVLKQNSDEKE